MVLVEEITDSEAAAFVPRTFYTDTGAPAIIPANSPVFFDLSTYGLDTHRYTYANGRPRSITIRPQLQVDHPNDIAGFLKAIAKELREGPLI